MVNLVNVESWEVFVHCFKCNAENKATLAQVKRGETIQCNICGTKIGLKDNNGNVEKELKNVQEAVDSLEFTLKKIGGSLKSNSTALNASSP